MGRWLPSRGAAVALDGANGGGTPAYDNSFPRFGPAVGRFRGKTLYWVVFSSRRPYGLQVNATQTLPATSPQLWLAGVAVGATIAGDPSFAPVWLPAQNAEQATPSDNHTPQWAKAAVTIN
jgi:hypothetical protein